MNTYIKIAEKIICGIILVNGSVSDIKYMKVNIIPPIVMTMIVIIYRLTQNVEDVPNIIIGFVPGIIVYCVSYAMKKTVGVADIIYMCYIGASYGLYVSCAIYSISYVLIWLSCLLWLFSGKKINKKMTLPYIPYLSVSWMCVLICSYTEGWFQ